MFRRPRVLRHSHHRDAHARSRQRCIPCPQRKACWSAGLEPARSISPSPLRDAAPAATPRGHFDNVVDLPHGLRSTHERAPGSSRRISDQNGLHRPRRVRLPALVPSGGQLLIPPHPPARRMQFGDCHHQSGRRQVAEHLRRCQYKNIESLRPRSMTS